MSHITLIGLPFTFLSVQEALISHRTGLLSVAASLLKADHQVKVVDALFEGFETMSETDDGLIRVGLDDGQIISRIPPSTDLIGVSVSFSHLAPMAHELIAAIKRAFPETLLVMGGVYPSTQPSVALTSETDYIVVGEGEHALCELLDNIRDGSDALPEGVYRKPQDGQEVQYKPVYIDDINALPMPARQLVAFEKYLTRSQRALTKKKSTAIITSRGCPYSCEFCSVHPVCGFKWRPRTAESTLGEIQFLYSEYGVRHLEIEDDNFTLSKRRTQEILSGIIALNEENPGDELSWSAPNGLRIDTLDEDLMALIKRSNCVYMMIALEHGDREVLKLMNKKLDLDKVREVVGLLDKYDIGAGAFTIYCYPGETVERFNNALGFYAELKVIAPSLSFIHLIAQPYPGTDLYKRCVDEGILKEGLFNNVDSIPRFSTEHNLILKTPDFDEREQKRRIKLLKKTLSRKRYYQELFLSLLPPAIQSLVRAVYRKLKGR